MEAGPFEAMLDLLVVGAGPAGVACAVQAHRDGLRAALVGDQPVGGLLRTARRLDNLPGLPGVPGPRYAQALALQLEGLGVPARSGELRALRALPGGGFEGWLAPGEPIRARCVCLATGTRPLPLPAWTAGLPQGRVLREARQLPPGLRDRRVVVVGGGEAALDTSLWARDAGAEVELLARGPRLRSGERLIQEAAGAGIELRPGTEVEAAAALADGVELRLVGGRRTRADWLVVCIGRAPRDELLRELVIAGRATPPGLSLAGDVRSPRAARYAALAIADGVRAALAARENLEVDA